jgi:hypothetical protein
MQRFWITHDFFCNEVNINFPYSPYSILDDFVHLMPIEDVEAFLEGFDSSDFTFGFEMEYVKFEKQGVYSEVVIRVDGTETTQLMETELVRKAVGEYIQAYKKLQEERKGGK